jgi:hypothetical protein
MARRAVVHISQPKRYRGLGWQGEEMEEDRRYRADEDNASSAGDNWWESESNSVERERDASRRGEEQRTYLYGSSAGCEGVEGRRRESCGRSGEDERR